MCEKDTVITILSNLNKPIVVLKIYEHHLMMKTVQNLLPELPKLKPGP